MSDRKFFIYARKSTDTEDRQVRSIGDQLSEMRELAAKENIQVVDVFIEKQTAKMPGRPILAQMLSRMEKGDASGILAWHPLCQFNYLWISLCVFTRTMKKNLSLKIISFSAFFHFFFLGILQLLEDYFSKLMLQAT